MNPEETVIGNFNLTALLKLSDLNLRRFAKNNPAKRTGDYFKTLSQFLSMAPDVSEVLKRFSTDSAYNDDWKYIKDIIALLNDMGCDKFEAYLTAIRNACGRGDRRQASIHADKVLALNFDNFCAQIQSAKKEKTADSSSEKDSNLSAFIKVTDEKEADRKYFVMAVDDSPAILEAVSAVLSANYEVFKLPKPKMLEKVLQQVKPDLFLLDYQMPELNGFELIPIIRGIEGHKDTPIIFLTSEGTVDNITAAIGLGACDFIVKPFNPEQLLEKVAKNIKTGN